MSKKKTPIIKLARQDYQPTKAEREEEVVLRKRGRISAEPNRCGARTDPSCGNHLPGEAQEVRSFTPLLA